MSCQKQAFPPPPFLPQKYTWSILGGGGGGGETHMNVITDWLSGQKKKDLKVVRSEMGKKCYNIYRNPGNNLRSPTRRNRHVHDYSFIPISTSTTSH